MTYLSSFSFLLINVKVEKPIIIVPNPANTNPISLSRVTPIIIPINTDIHPITIPFL